MKNIIKIKKITKEKFEQYLILLLSFAYSFGVGNAEKYIVLIILFAMIINAFIFDGGKIYIERNKQLRLLSIWGITYSIMYIMDGNGFLEGFVYYLGAPFIITMAYKRISIHFYQEKQYILLFIVLTLGFYLHGLVDVLISIKNHVFIYSSEYVLDYWSDSYINRTIIGMYLTPFVCISIPIILLGRKIIGIVTRMILSGAFIVAVLISIYLGNRSLLIISALLIFFGMIFGFKVSKHKSIFLCNILIIIFFVLVLGFFNQDTLAKYISQSFLTKRYQDGALNNSRFLIYSQIGSHFWDYAFGWITSREANTGISLSFAHNVWLDILIYGGFLSAFFFVMYTISIMKDVISIYKKSNYACFKLLVITFTIGIFLNWFVEPVLNADPYYFSSCCGIFSVCGQYAKKLRLK